MFIITLVVGYLFTCSKLTASVPVKKDVDGSELKDLPSSSLVSNFMNNGVDVIFHQKREDFHGEGTSKQIDIEKQTLELLFHLDEHRRHKRVIMTYPGYLWSGGVTPYEFSSQISVSERVAITIAMKQIEDNTCVRFYDRRKRQRLYHVTHNSYLNFISSSGCWSYVGRRFPGKQDISACNTKLRALHELLHALGAFHEQSAPNRDDYIQIKYGNILQGKSENFKKVDGWYSSSSVYSPDSVMHYKSDAMSGNGFRTIVPLVDYITFSQTSSWNSFRELNAVYKCTENCRLSCHNGGYPAFRFNQCTCACIDGLDPTTGCTTFSPTVNGEFIDLNAGERTAHLNLRTATSGFRFGRKYMWMVRGPLGSRIALDFTKLLVAGSRDFCHSRLVITSGQLGGPSFVLCGAGFQRTILSENNTLLVTLTSNSVNDGLSAKVRLLPGEEWCYNLGDRGATYDGEVNRAADNSECLNWTRATDCLFNPFNMSSLPADYSGNACRNPGGVLARPWCYTNIDDAGCDIKYCDACSYGRVYDSYDDCASLLDVHHTYCDSEDAQHGCRKTCGLKSIPVTSARQCASPEVALGSTVVGQLARLYDIGSDVTFQCTNDPVRTWKRYCLSTGHWSDVDTVCGDLNECVDMRRGCGSVMVNLPDMCDRYPRYSRFCPATCGRCPGQEKECSVPSPTTNDQVLLTHNTTPIYPGSEVKYRCAPSKHLLSGNLVRACRLDLTLTGQPPICAGLSDTTGWVNSMPMTPLKSVSPRIPFAVFGASKYTTVLRSGSVLCWRMYCVRPGRIRFVVVRRQHYSYFPNYRYTVIGHNDVNCHDDRVMTWCPPISEQIQVLPGDLLGVVDLVGSNIQYILCDKHLSSGMFSEYASYNKAGEMKAGYSFVAVTRFQICLLYGINAQIGPPN